MRDRAFRTLRGCIQGEGQNLLMTAPDRDLGHGAVADLLRTGASLEQFRNNSSVAIIGCPVDGRVAHRVGDINLRTRLQQYAHERRIGIGRRQHQGGRLQPLVGARIRIRASLEAGGQRSRITCLQSSLHVRGYLRIGGGHGDQSGAGNE
jgi:hypothetical protein